MADASKMTWSVPRWAFVPQLWQSLRRCVLNGQSIRNICAGTLVSCGVIVIVLKIAVPGLVLPNLWHVILALPLILLALVLQFGILAVFPPSVTLRPSRFSKSHGQTGVQIKAEQFVAIQLFVHRQDRIRLKLRYRRRDRLHTLLIGVPNSVDLDQLVTMLPISPKIRDARPRSISVAGCS